jgi:hypothetical protein
MGGQELSQRTTGFPSRAWPWVLCSAWMLAALELTAGEFRVRPYLQNPSTDGVTIRWLTNSGTPGTVTVDTPAGPKSWTSQPLQSPALRYNPWKEEPGGPHPDLPWLHSVRVTGLPTGGVVEYRVEQGPEQFSGRLQTAPTADTPIRLAVFSDSETEPESSTSPPVEWPVPAGAARPDGLSRYVANQTVGYRENLKLIAAAEPHLLLIAGDLVETGGEQRDWDEFWKHVAGDEGHLASRVPILPALGNHENFAGPGGGYTAEGADFSTAKYLTYFDLPSNGAASSAHHGRYYRVDYGPVTIITLDSSDGLPHKTEHDTNHSLEGSQAPDFNPGSEQYRWLEQELARAQRHSRFTLVQFHHTMFGSGPHSVPFGQPGFSGQSGIALRVLLPLFHRYGVDAVFSGHDEMLERSAVPGVEQRPDGSARPFELPCYDVGLGGDGLRGPVNGSDNPYRRFLAHVDAPEVWDGPRLVHGGKHYGHLDVTVSPDANGLWSLRTVPVMAFPLMDEAGVITGWERREYADVVTITAP